MTHERVSGVADREVLSDEARRSFRDLLNEVEHQGAHITIVRYKTPSAVLVPVGWYEGAREALQGERDDA
jgi:prevent-host-death family protein